jgi:hypothetical protein
MQTVETEESFQFVKLGANPNCTQCKGATEMCLNKSREVNLDITKEIRKQTKHEDR